MALHGPVVPAPLLLGMARTLAQSQPVFARTGGLHAAGIFDSEGNLLVVHEDVGRHNAFDKVIGELWLARRVPLHGAVALVSGRISFEIVQKAIAAGIGVLAGVSAPSSLAVEVAGRAGMTLVGFLRAERFNIYTGGDRITGLPRPQRRRS